MQLPDGGGQPALPVLIIVHSIIVKRKIAKALRAVGGQRGELVRTLLVDDALLVEHQLLQPLGTVGTE